MLSEAKRNDALLRVVIEALEMTEVILIAISGDFDRLNHLSKTTVR